MYIRGLIPPNFGECGQGSSGCGLISADLFLNHFSYLLSKDILGSENLVLIALSLNDEIKPEINVQTHPEFLPLLLDYTNYGCRLIL